MEVSCLEWHGERACVMLEQVNLNIIDAGGIKTCKWLTLIRSIRSHMDLICTLQFERQASINIDATDFSSCIASIPYHYLIPNLGFQVLQLRLHLVQIFAILFPSEYPSNNTPLRLSQRVPHFLYNRSAASCGLSAPVSLFYI